MSVDAISSVTGFLRQLLLRQLKHAHPLLALQVTTLPPGKALSEVKGANLYLYRVAESPFTRNQPWRGDRKPQAPTARPALGLQLFYMITPLDPDAGDDPTGTVPSHQYLGAIMLTLHENPVLNDVHLPAGGGLPEVDGDTLTASVHDSYETVKVMLLPATVDEVTKIWATMNEPYRLSVAYEVSLVELTPTAPPSPRAGIVLSTGVFVETLYPPQVTGLEPPTGPLQTAGGAAKELTITGSGLLYPRDPKSPLAKQLPAVTVGGRRVALKPGVAPTDAAVTVLLPADLDAGPHADVRVTVNGATSAPLTFTIDPWVSGTRPLRTAVPPEAPGTTDPAAHLVFTGVATAKPTAVHFQLGGAAALPKNNFEPADPTKPDEIAHIPIPTNLENGLYMVRLVLADGSVSNARTLEIIPRVDEVAVATDGDGHKLTVSGARLGSKTEARLVLDGVAYLAAPSVATPDTFTYTLKRKLPAGPHRLAVSIDGHVSRTLNFPVPPA